MAYALQLGLPGGVRGLFPKKTAGLKKVKKNGEENV